MDFGNKTENCLNVIEDDGDGDGGHGGEINSRNLFFSQRSRVKATVTQTTASTATTSILVVGVCFGMNNMIRNDKNTKYAKAFEFETNDRISVTMMHLDEQAHFEFVCEILP